MVHTVFVGNIAFESTRDEILDIFSEAGTVTNFNLVTDHDTGKPKGFGFVEYNNEASAHLAIRKLDKREHRGRQLRVGYADADKPVEAQRTADGEPLESETLSQAKVLEFLFQMQQIAKTNRNLARQYLLSNPKLAYAVLSALYSQGFAQNASVPLLDFLSSVQLPVIDDQPVQAPSVAPHAPPTSAHHPPPGPPTRRVLPELAHLPPDQYENVVNQLLAATQEQIDALPQEQKELYYRLVSFYRS
ncbi:hypothetical protein P9112_014228 [Eukaryota sp. TZLM1-RC]